VRYAALEFGGFLGLGKDRYPIPWSSLKYDIRRKGYVVPLPRDSRTFLQSHPCVYPIASLTS